VFDTIICFKNHVDDFYLKYIEENSINVEIFSIKGVEKKKVGEAKLPLTILRKNDQSHQVQQIKFNRRGIDMPVGKIFYRARMRNPLKDAIEFQQRKL